jgi:hypothetical protein
MLLKILPSRRSDRFVDSCMQALAANDTATIDTISALIMIPRIF